MSHFCVLVIGENVEEQLAPYCESDEQFTVFQPTGQEAFEKFKQEYPDSYKNYLEGYEEYKKECETNGDQALNLIDHWAEDWHGAQIHPTDESLGFGYFTNPNAKWDWYEIGGRWSGFFKVKAGTNGQKFGQYFHGAPETATDYADIVSIENWDITGLREETRQNAEQFYDKLEGVLKGRQLPSWSEILENNSNDITLARNEYHSNEVMMDLRAAEIYCFGDLREEFKNSRQEYVDSMVEAAGVPFSVVKDGTWYQKGEMGWFGMSHNEKEEDSWNKEFWSILSSLPPDTTLTLVDCHI
jgi:hypothetical protein